MRALGATAVTYEEVPELEPFDVILDQVGGDLFATGLKLLATARRRSWGSASRAGRGSRVDPALLVGRNATVAGFFLGRFMKLRPDAVRAAAFELLELWSEGAIAPSVGATFPLAEADDALRLVADRRSTGKVVLVP